MDDMHSDMETELVNLITTKEMDEEITPTLKRNYSNTSCNKMLH